MKTAEQILGQLLIQHKFLPSVENLISNTAIHNVQVDRSFESPALVATFDFVNGDQIIIKLKEF